MHIKKDDMVIVISGKDKGVKGKVVKAMPKDSKVIVEKVNVRKKHQKPTREMQQAGIMDKECPIDASNVLIYCDKCKQGVRTGAKVLEDGSKVRYCKKCGETFGK